MNAVSRFHKITFTALSLAAFTGAALASEQGSARADGSSTADPGVYTSADSGDTAPMEISGLKLEYDVIEAEDEASEAAKPLCYMKYTLSR